MVLILNEAVDNNCSFFVDGKSVNAIVSLSHCHALVAFEMKFLEVRQILPCADTIKIFVYFMFHAPSLACDLVKGGKIKRIHCFSYPRSVGYKMQI